MTKHMKQEELTMNHIAKVQHQNPEMLIFNMAQMWSAHIVQSFHCWDPIVSKTKEGVVHDGLQAAEKEVVETQAKNNAAAAEQSRVDWLAQEAEDGGSVTSSNM